MFDTLWEAYLLRFKLRAFMGIAALFLVSIVMSCQELRYMVSGKSEDVYVTTHIQTVTPRRGGAPYPQRVVGWTYQDGSTQRQKYVNVAMDWQKPADGKLKIQYIPGRDASRIYGESNRVWVIVFFGSLALVVVAGFVVVRYG